MIFEKPWENGILKISENGRGFCCGDEPFFWMGDTAWLLFSQLTLEESYRYLRNRKELGYNVILADFIHTSLIQNIYGEKPLENGDFSKINENSGYWKQIDTVIRMAEDLGLYMGLLTVWGSDIVAGKHLNEKNLTDFMNFVLDRYHDFPNIIWIVGGDVRGDVNPSVFCEMGKMMKKDKPDRLVGYHPFGRTSSALWFHEENWLDFNLFQSGHRRYDQVRLNEWDDNVPKEDWFGEDSWKYVERDYKKEPVKPVLDGEPSYEWILQGLHDIKQPYWTAKDVRRYAYWSVFAGAAGHTYGHNAVMQFYRDKSEPGAFGVKHLWEEAIHHPGAAQMIHLKKLMESVDYINGRPAQELLLSQQMEKYDRISVFAGEKYIMAYSYTGRDIRLSLEDYKEKEMSAYWVNPVTGMKSFICDIKEEGDREFKNIDREDSEDIILLLIEKE